VALALVLVVGAGLLVRSLMLLNAVHPGLDPRNVLAVTAPFPRSLYTSGGNTPDGGLMVQFDSRFTEMRERLRQRLLTIPGVDAVATTVTPPLGGTPWRMAFAKGRLDAAAQRRDGWSAEWYPVSPAYFETLRIPVVRGRAIGVEDRETSRPVAVINATMARVYWPDEDPVGQLLQVDLLDDVPREIVGVVGDVTQDRYQVSAQAQLYVPHAQLPHRMDMTLSLDALIPTFLVRTGTDSAAVLPAIRSAVSEINPTLPISSVRSVEDYSAAQLSELSQYAIVLGVFGMLSVALAVVGIVGVMAQAVGQQTHEIAIRMALGAYPLNVLVYVLRQGLTLIAAGLGVGLLASFVVTPLMRSFLWGVTTTDPVTLAFVSVALAVIATMACYLPARRALKVAPIVALRSE
jgi:putative ABC transport system permease protein